MRDLMDLKMAQMLPTAALALLLVAVSASTARAQDLLDEDTQGLETATGHWLTWYSTTLTRSTAAAAAGVASLRVDITGTSWGLGFDHWPGFLATPGTYELSVSTLQGVGSLTDINVRVRWKTVSGADVAIDDVSLPTPSSTWRRTTQQLVAPAGTERMLFEVTGGTATDGDYFFLDDIHVVPPQAGTPDSSLNLPEQYDVSCASTVQNGNTSSQAVWVLLWIMASARPGIRRRPSLLGDGRGRRLT
jgi:hypothetical protein